MICPKCKADNSAGAIFCNQCGKKLVTTKKTRRKTRGNGTGCAYYDSVHRYWVAQVVDGYRELPPFDLNNPENKKQRVPIKKTKGGFKRKEDALAYCQELEDLGEGKYRYTFYVEDRMPGSDCWAVFSGYNEDTFCEVRVLLSSAQ